MPTGDHWFVLGLRIRIGDQRTSGLGLFTQRCRGRVLAFVESLAQFAVLRRCSFFSQHRHYFTLTFSQSQAKLPADHCAEDESAPQFLERRWSVGLY